jgi:hypothetical protein
MRVSSTKNLTVLPRAIQSKEKEEKSYGCIPLNQEDGFDQNSQSADGSIGQ